MTIDACHCSCLFNMDAGDEPSLWPFELFDNLQKETVYTYGISRDVFQSLHSVG